MGLKMSREPWADLETALPRLPTMAGGVAE
jgi:hypothetical protein